MDTMKEQALKRLNEMVDENFTNIGEAEAYLTKRFQDAYDYTEEAQLAFDEVDSELDGLLGEYFVYTLSADGETWYVGKGIRFKEDALPAYMKAFEEHYNETFTTIDDCTSKLEYRVMKDMSNAGCDAFSALAMILSEDLDLDGVFEICGADAEPCIEWANFDKFLGE